MEHHNWEYRGALDRVVDGDTVDFRLDLGFGIFHDIRVRLKGVDTAEIYGVEKQSEEYQQGIIHKNFVRDWLEEGVNGYSGDWPFIIVTHKDETGKYGRYLARIMRKSDSTMLRKKMLAEFPEVESE